MVRRSWGRRALALAAAGALAAMLGLAACAGEPAKTGAVDGTAIMTVDAGDVSGGVAATVGGVEIGENAVTASVNNLLVAQGLEGEQQWAAWMGYVGYSSAVLLRSDVLQTLIGNELVRQAAESEGITVTDAEVDEAVAQAEADVEDVAAWLEAMGTDEATYRETTRVNLLRQKLKEKVAGDVGVSDEEVLEHLKSFYPMEVPADATSLDGISPDRVSYVRDLFDGMARDQAYSAWMSEFRAKADIAINAMPDSLFYDIEPLPADEAAELLHPDDGEGDLDEEEEE